MPIRQGWEVSRDRIGWYEKIMNSDNVGDVVITSKCRLGSEYGFLVASDTGFAWRIRTSGPFAMMSAGASKWVRWHDVDHINQKKEGYLSVYIKVRNKKGSLKLDGKGNIKVKRWSLRLSQIKDESKPHFAERKAEFYNIMSELHNQYQGPTNPPTSDSRI